MRFFKHGSVLAISLPESLRQKLGISENDEYEFVALESGVLALVRKGQFVSAEKINQSLSNPTTPGTSAATFSTSKPSTSAQKSAPTFSRPASSSFSPSAKLSPSTPAKPPASTYAASGTALDRQGYLVLATEDEAKAFSQRFESQIKAGDIKGVRGFDKKFYLASRAYSDAFADRLLVALKEPATASFLAASLRQPVDGVLTLLYLLKEEGEVIEKKRGLFVRVL